MQSLKVISGRDGTHATVADTGYERQKESKEITNLQGMTDDNITPGSL